MYQNGLKLAQVKRVRRRTFGVGFLKNVLHVQCENSEPISQMKKAIAVVAATPPQEQCVVSETTFRSWPMCCLAGFNLEMELFIIRTVRWTYYSFDSAQKRKRPWLDAWLHKFFILFFSVVGIEIKNLESYQLSEPTLWLELYI